MVLLKQHPIFESLENEIIYCIFAKKVVTLINFLLTLFELLISLQNLARKINYVYYFA